MAGSGDAHLREDAVVTLDRVVVEYSTSKGTVQAVSDISLDLTRGETLGLVGESGCGKSSLGRAVLQLPAPTSGSVRVDGVDLCALTGSDLKTQRKHVQMVFQDPISSLNPRRKVGDIVAEGLRIQRPELSGDETAAKVDEVLEAVGLDPARARTRRASEFSGGQCQRIAIARALVLEPDVLVCDEPVSALDVSVQAQILNLLEDMKERYGLTMLFISHDLGVVRNVSDRVAVMYLGKLCEIAPTVQLYEQPAHPYTRLLLSSIPSLDENTLTPVSRPDAELPSPLDPPSGCRFRTRCPFATDRCAALEPELREVQTGRHVACHHPLLENR
jgi:peptide/nickel transport system ATP-binding protein